MDEHQPRRIAARPLRSAPLYLAEGEIAREVGVSCEHWRAAAAVLEKSGLPEPDPLFEGRRYWPAVKAFLDRRHGLGQSSFPSAPDGEENWDECDREPKHRARP